MRESRFYREVLEEDREEGKLQARRNAILDAMQERFGEKAASKFTDAIRRIDDLAELARLHRLAIRCKLPAEFKASLFSS